MAVVYAQFTLINVCMWRWISSDYMHGIQYYQQIHTSAILYYQCKWEVFPTFAWTHINILLVQSTPLPSNPSLHVHTKLPITSAQVAFSWQLSMPSSHSSMSAKDMDFICLYTCQPYYQKDINSVGDFPYLQQYTWTSYLCNLLHFHQIHCCTCIQNYQSHQHMWHSHGSCLFSVHTHQCLHVEMEFMSSMLNSVAYKQEVESLNLLG